MNGIDLVMCEAYRQAMKGFTVSPRGNPTREVTMWNAPPMDPHRRVPLNSVRDLRVGYAAVKVAWDLAERRDPEPLLFWNPNGEWYVDNGIFWGESYGHRFMPSLRAAIEVLKRDTNSRRAWVPVFEARDHNARTTLNGEAFEAFPSRDFRNVPCCAGFQLRQFEDRLDMQVVMRSQSIGVMPYDMFLFSVVLELCANELSVWPGQLEWSCMSLHVYENELDRRQREFDWWVNNGVYTPKMAPLGYDLDQARERWSQHLDDPSGLVSVDPDGLEELMIAGFPRSHEPLPVIE